MLKANLFCQSTNQCFMLWECVAMDKANSHTPESLVIETLQLLFDFVLHWPFQDPDHLTRKTTHELMALVILMAGLHLSLIPLRILGIILERNTFINLNDLLVQHIWSSNSEIKN